MADILSFNVEPKQDAYVNYSVDVTLYPKDIEFTIHGVKTDEKSRLRIAEELERIVRIIRNDVVTGDLNT